LSLALALLTACPVTAPSDVGDADAVDVPADSDATESGAPTADGDAGDAVDEPPADACSLGTYVCDAAGDGVVCRPELNAPTVEVCDGARPWRSSPRGTTARTPLQRPAKRGFGAKSYVAQRPVEAGGGRPDQVLGLNHNAPWRVVIEAS